MLNTVITHATGDVFPASDWNTYLRDNMNAYGVGRITVSAWSGGPPASPSDGDIWIATAVDANGTRWHFQYNAGSASASKWEFIGGPPTYSSVETTEATVSSSYAALGTAGPSITLARAGDWLVAISCEAITPTNAGLGFLAEMSYDVGATGAQDADSVYAGNAVNSATSVWASCSRPARLKTGLAAATALVAKYKTTSGTSVSFAQRAMAVQPVRIA